MAIRGLALLLALSFSIPGVADDQQKAQKEINRVTAMARDLTGRAIVNLSLSQMFNLSRSALVEQRGQTGLNYGSLFLANELVKSGVALSDIAAQLKAGKRITEIANAAHANWKEITEDAKKLNARVDRNLYDYFLIKDSASGAAEPYDVHRDGVKADADDVSEKEIASARDRFLLWKDSAAKAKGDDKTLSKIDEMRGRVEHTQGPGQVGNGRGSSTSNTNSGVSAPGFGGPQ